MLGGCLESFYDILTTTRYEDEKAVCEKYGLFPEIEEWREKVLFIETCEEKPVPEQSLKREYSLTLSVKFWWENRRMKHTMMNIKLFL